MRKKKNAAASAETTAKGMVTKLGNIETEGIVINGSKFRPLDLSQPCNGWDVISLTQAIDEEPEHFVREDFFELKLNDGEEVPFTTVDMEAAIKLLQDPMDFEMFVSDFLDEENFASRFKRIFCLAIGIVVGYTKFIERSYGIEILIPSGDD